MSSESSSTIPFVDLKRSFWDWRPEREQGMAETSGNDASEPTEAKSWNWASLLTQRRVVLLAEPGSGKTREMKETVAGLRAKGVAAYFVRLDRLISAELPEILGPAQALELQQVLRNGTEAYYFLDSVDEAKLARSSDFYGALAKFSSALGSLGRSQSRIFISSRVSEWRPEADFAEVTTQLCGPLQQKMVTTEGGVVASAEEDQLVVVKLSPLDAQQVNLFARAIGTTNVEQFTNAIDQAFAWEFARRPLDVIDLARFWNEAQRLGSLTELVQAHVRRNLGETPERVREQGSPLTEKDALDGALSLAAAAVLCQKSAFAVAPGIEGLDASECLPAGWSPAQINALLGRSLFDDASFGKRQFHHRRATEFLAAKWMERRMDGGCALSTLREVFFEPSPEGFNLRPPLEATAAWLCGISKEWSRDFRSWVLASRPEIHLSFGDPEALSSEHRRDVLRQIAARYADRNQARFDVDQTTLSRFATPDLAQEIARLFLDATTVLQLRWHLLHMAALRKLTGCVGSALVLLGIEGVDDQLKTEAVELVSAAGNEGSMESLASYARVTSTLSESTGMALIRALFPRYLTTTDLVEVASKVHESDLPIFPTVFSRYLEEHRSLPNQGELLHVFLELLQREPRFPTTRRGVGLSQQFSRLRPVLIPLGKHVLQKDSLSETEVGDVVVALLFVGERSHDYDAISLEGLTAATERHPEVRRAYFLRCIDLAVEEDGHEPTHFFFFPLGNNALLRLELRDLGWLVPNLAVHPDSARRLTLFRIAMQVWVKGGRPRDGKRKILQAIHGFTELRAEFGKIMSGVRRAPFYFWWETKIRYRFGQRFWWQNNWRIFRQWIELWRSRIRFNCSLWGIASGHDLGTLCYLVGETSERGGHSWTAPGWENLSLKFGPLVARATRTGCARFWRRHNPGAPSAKPTANRTSGEVIVGLNGIQEEWTRCGLNFSGLSVDDANTATFYAVNELNAPPAWLNNLAASQPSAVGAALMTCIEHEWTMPPDPVRVFGVLAKVLGRSDVLGGLVEAGLLQLLARGDPTQPQLLDFALRLLIPRRPAGFAAVAKARTLDAPAGSAAAILWASAWLRTEAVSAVAWLQTLPADATSTDRLIEGVCCSLHGGDMFRPVRDRNASYLQTPPLPAFIRVVYQHVRLADDQVHHGSYSPNGRDHAQEFRNMLLSILAEHPGEETASELSALADSPFLAAVRDNVLDRRDAQARSQIRSQIWRANDIREFTMKDETDPHSDEDLNRITLRRLGDIKHAVELSDYSIRNGLRDTDDEYALRHLIATELLRRANGRYRPPQEVEIDEERRPDIRIEHAAVAGPISIEIKWAENWTLEELLSALEHQLVGTYLRPEHSHYGVFLVGMIARNGKTRWANPEGGTRLNFTQVVDRLRARATELQASTPGVRGVAVVAIDFRPPSRWAE